MDTSKRQVSVIESFPPDIWAYFVWYIPGEQLGRLMMTGATLLWQRLMAPQVVKSIKLGKDFMVFKSLPKFLHDLPSLEELSILSCSLDWSDSLDLTIASIPSGVRKLEVGGTWWLRRNKNLFRSSETLNLSKHLPHLDTLLVLDLKKVQDFSWLANSPTSLTKLTLRRWSGPVELPPSLIHFEANTVDLSKSSVSKLPPLLVSFVAIKKVLGVENLVPLLPPSVRKLSLGHTLYILDRSGTFKSGLHLELLPRSLTWLNVTGIDFESNPELASHLPSTLTEATFQGISCPAWPLFPRNLTKLCLYDTSLSPMVPKVFDMHGKLHEVTSYPFDTLPRSITSLEFGTRNPNFHLCRPPAPSIQSYFPPQLTNLNIPMIQLSPGTAKLLPSSLLFLNVGNLCELVCQHLPSGLKTLISSGSVITPNLVKFLPTSLTFLDLSGAHRSNGSDWKPFSPLPSTLTHLGLHFIDLGDSFLLHQHLPNLLELNLEHSKQISDLSIPLLSPHLTTLKLPSSSMVTGKSFEFLPRGLTHLNLDSSKSIFDSEMKHLPRTLKYVHMQEAIHLTDLCIPGLPPHLEFLNLQFNCRITMSSRPNFPYPMRSTQNPNSAQFMRWHRM